MARRHAVHEMFSSRKAPKPVGPYSQAIRVEKPGEMLFVSGQLPIEVPSGKVFTGDIARQAEIALWHVRNIVQDAKFSMDEVVKCTLYLTDMQSFDKVNEVYQRMFVGQNLPARAVVGVASLPKGAGIEVEAVAVKRAEGGEDPFGGMDFS